jgi:uncharacterized membrane protein YecN with MAPEG domain
MALRDHVEGREAIGVAALSVVMWVGICWIFGLPTLMVWIVGVLLFVGGVAKSGGSSPPDPAAPVERRDPDAPPDETRLYGPKE